MHICGIIAEYDPFHTGHALQINTARNMLGEDCAVVCVMSGNWTQRGSAAIADKFLRAKLALMGGADLVLELPLPYAISSAEWFARGGVSCLNATGIVTHICFGSEWGELSPLAETARCLDSAEYSQTLHTFLDQGLSFPAARHKAVSQLLGKTADCLQEPNNNLGVEYLRALKWSNSIITPITVQRQGAGHSEAASNGYASASHLRQLLRENNFEAALPYLIDGEADLLRNAQLSCPELADRAVMYRLRQMSIEQLETLPDCGEGLANRLYHAIRQASCPEDILALAKSKRYTLARLRRILLWAFLGMTAADRPDELPYLRVLGMNKTGQTLLRQMKKHSAVPILTKAAHVRNMSEQAQRLFWLEARATDLYSLVFPEVLPCGIEWTHGPEII